jgi:uncharacterized protein YjbI with pentapeptide repeats
MIGLFMSALVDLSSAKLGSVSLTGRKLQGLRRLSPDLISKAIDETRAQVTRIGLTFLGTTAFCLLSLLSPDSALLGGSERINVPFAGPVSFLGFMLLGPAVLIVLRIYLQIYVEHGERLDRLARSMSIMRAPVLVPLQNRLIRYFSGLIFYLLLPLTMLLFAWKAAAFPALGSGLLVVAEAVVASHLMLPLKKFSWRSKAVLSTGAALVVLTMIVWVEPVRRPFALSRASLSGQWLVGEDFRDANLSRANLSGASLGGANLDRASLTVANLTDADLTIASLSGANLLGARLAGANLTKADLRVARLGSANLAGANLFGADLAAANLSVANLTMGEFSGAFLTVGNVILASLSGTNLTGANLIGANLTGANLSDANLTGANLSGADLVFANLSGANLSGAKNLTQMQLNQACGDEKTKLPEARRHHRINKIARLTLKPCN